MRFGEKDERAYMAAKRALLDGFGAWLASTCPSEDAEDVLANADTFLSWRYTYSTGVLDDFRHADLDLCELFLSAPELHQPAEVLQQMWRHDAPDTADVLDVLGRSLQDRALAKQARKALLQHRSWIANRR